MKSFTLFYVAMIFIFAIYGTNWGSHASSGFMYNFGASILWPIKIFPALGEIIGGIVIVGAIGYYVLNKNGAISDYMLNKYADKE